VAEIAIASRSSDPYSRTAANLKQYQFLHAHDGFTLNDLSAISKHNEANGEETGMEMIITSPGIAGLKVRRITGCLSSCGNGKNAIFSLL
jgi:pullulanase/glycogen debranching enzyme